MTDVLRATYADLKTVKTRGAVQLILELPIEALGDVVGLLGAPLPGGSVWVAVARLRGDGEASEPEPEPHQIAGPPADENRPPLRMSASAAIISKEGAFATFMRDRHGYTTEPDEALKLFCGIDSKRELDDEINSAARSNFLTLRSQYWSWLKCEEPA